MALSRKELIEGRPVSQSPTLQLHLEKCEIMTGIALCCDARVGEKGVMQHATLDGAKRNRRGKLRPTTACLHACMHPRNSPWHEKT